MNDKHDEPPQVIDGYGVSVAYACLVDTVRAIQIEVRPDIHQPVSLQPSITTFNIDDHVGEIDQKVTPTEDNNDKPQKTTEVKRSSLHEQIINSSWCGLLSALCPLIESWLDYIFIYFIKLLFTIGVYVFLNCTLYLTINGCFVF